MRLLAFMRAMWIYAAWMPIARGEPQWTPADTAALKHFLQTPAGAKLARMLAAKSAACNANAVLRADRHEYAAGYAAGFRAFGGLIEAFAVDVSPKEDEAAQDGPMGEADLREHLSP
ncbi:MAG: hypothetical protein AB1705_08570 [Verrucomicrobiota bacterium]